MAGNVVQMDYNIMGAVAGGFSQAQQTMLTVGKVLVGIIGTLTMLSFLGNGPALALRFYLESDLLPRVNKIGKVCGEFSSDLNRAVSDHKRGDLKGKSYFGEGLR